MNYGSIALLLLLAKVTFSQNFTETSQTSGVIHEHVDPHIMGGGAAFFDYNKDGYEDIYITGGNNRDQLFENNQNGTFSEIGIAAGLGMTSAIKTNGVTTGDIDNDGYREIFVTTSEDYANLLFYNNGDGTFTDISTSAGLTALSWSMSASFGDYDNDGFLDLYVGEYVNYFNTPFYNFMSTGIPNKLYHNNGNLTFNEVGASANVNNNGGALSTAFTDFDNDSDLDILLGNDFGGLFGGNGLFLNNYPTIDFTDISVSSDIYNEINAMGIAIGDFDEDLDLDYYVTNMMANLFHVNNNDQTFTQSAVMTNTESASVVSWGTFFFDYDNDTYLDLFCASGGVMTMANPQQNVLYQNQQNGTFLDVTVGEGMDSIRRSRGAIYGDIDNDGALDVLVVNVDGDGTSPEPTKLYTNSNTNNWVELDLMGISANRDGFGSHIRLVAGGRSFLREIGGGSSYLSQNSSVAHFGLSSIIQVDSAIVTWPNGHQDIYTNLPINQRTTLIEDLTGIQDLPSFDLNVYPNPATEQLLCSIQGSVIKSIEIIDMRGNQVYFDSTVNKKNVSINVSKIPTGYYQLILKDQYHSFLKKIVID